MNAQGCFKELKVTLEGAEYAVRIGRRILDGVTPFIAGHSSDRRVLIVLDEFFRDKILGQLFDDLAGKGFFIHLHYLPGGKTHKNIHEAIRIYTTLETNDFARDSTLIAIGGGVIGDLAGFVASTYFRGMNLVHIPTTMTAMIDSSIGGKVGINFRGTVNAIGSYHHPLLNIVDFQFVDTLPERDYRAGLAEIIKCAVIYDAALFDYFNRQAKAILAREHDALMHIVERAVEIKLVHVSGDVREQGRRLKLNYGHTLGHAIEASTGTFEEIYRHGEGVSLGMVGAARIAQSFLGQSKDILARHEEILRRYDLPVRVAAESIGFERAALRQEFLRNLQKDKKRKDNQLRFILPRSIGCCEVYDGVPASIVEDAFDYLLESGT